MVQSSAPGKIILFGEHAVVYGRPAIAVPLSDLRATAAVRHGRRSGVWLLAPDLGVEKRLAESDADDAFTLVVRLVREAATLEALPDMEIEVRSAIPIAGGLGSGAAISAAMVRALVEFLGLDHRFDDAKVSQFTYEVEKIHHGTPSGIDNTVVTYEQPVYFARRSPTNLVETFEVKRALRILVADTGVQSSTKIVVDDVRLRWRQQTAVFEKLFDLCGQSAERARKAIEEGDLYEIGHLMNVNHKALTEMTVSSVELDRLVERALSAGALGAKLSGGGRGGNMLALVTPELEHPVRKSLLDAGATAVFATTIS